MSAIFGIVDFEGRPLKDEWIRSMQTDLAHRGPDGQGLYREESIALGHMLLQVTPESVYDSSPYEEDRYVITANARLDEREAIMDRLGMGDEERDMITDPLLLLRSFRKFGKDFVKDIYGDFAFAIWNKQKRELFCARDQVGVKPFLYYIDNGRLVFSTEKKALINLDFVVTRIDHQFLRNQVLYIFEEQGNTEWLNIKRLSPAHTLLATQRTCLVKRYWAPKYRRDNSLRTDKDSADALAGILKRVISDHSRVTNGVGLSLSGGMDSSTIACIAAEMGEKKGQPIITVSSVLDKYKSVDGEEDEIDYIRSVLDGKKNLQPFFIYHSQLSFFRDINFFYDQHYSQVTPFYQLDAAILSEFAGKSVRRVFSGLFGDYTVSNRTINPFAYLIRTCRFNKLYQLVTAYNNKTGSGYFSIFRNVIKSFVPLDLIFLRERILGRIPGWDLNLTPIRLVPGERRVLRRRLVLEAIKEKKMRRDISQSIWPSNSGLLEEYWDCGPAHYNLEMTFPLADRRIIEFMHSVPLEHLYAGGEQRGLIRLAMKGILPDKIGKRTTKGAYSPGYAKILSRDLNILTTGLKSAEPSLLNELSDLLDFEKLHKSLEDLVNRKNLFYFTVEDWIALRVGFWYLFENWVIKKIS